VRGGAEGGNLSSDISQKISFLAIPYAQNSTDPVKNGHQAGFAHYCFLKPLYRVMKIST
jgi:hypothetical protein